MLGTCIWFKNTYGYIGYGLNTNNSYEGQVYVHYKNILRKGLRNNKYRELKQNDICEFEISEGFHSPGTQAINVKIVEYGDSDKGYGTQDAVKQNP